MSTDRTRLAGHSLVQPNSPNDAPDLVAKGHESIEPAYVDTIRAPRSSQNRSAYSLSVANLSLRISEGAPLTAKNSGRRGAARRGKGKAAFRSLDANVTIGGPSRALGRPRENARGVAATGMGRSVGSSRKSLTCETQDAEEACRPTPWATERKLRHR